LEYFEDKQASNPLPLFFTKLHSQFSSCRDIGDSETYNLQGAAEITLKIWAVQAIS
jgi:hypothetical protein